jgi:hypothetical protein
LSSECFVSASPACPDSKYLSYYLQNKYPEPHPARQPNYTPTGGGQRKPPPLRNSSVWNKKEKSFIFDDRVLVMESVSKSAEVFDTISILMNMFGFLNAFGLAAAHQCCNAFKVLIPSTARAREHYFQQQWIANAVSAEPVFPSEHDMKIPPFLATVGQKSRGAWGESASKGWTETMHIQEQHFIAKFPLSTHRRHLMDGTL